MITIYFYVLIDPFSFKLSFLANEILNIYHFPYFTSLHFKQEKNHKIQKVLLASFQREVLKLLHNDFIVVCTSIILDFNAYLNELRVAMRNNKGHPHSVLLFLH